MATITIRYIDHAVQIRKYLAEDSLPFSEYRTNDPLAETIISTEGLLSPKYLRALKSFIRDKDLDVEVEQ